MIFVVKNLMGNNYRLEENERIFIRPGFNNKDLNLTVEIQKIFKPYELPIIMLTSIGKNDNDFMSAEFAAALTKPVLPTQFFEVITRVITKIR